MTYAASLHPIAILSVEVVDPQLAVSRVRLEQTITDFENLPTHRLAVAEMAREPPIASAERGAPGASGGIAYFDERVAQPLAALSGFAAHIGYKHARGYEVKDFQDAFASYLPGISSDETK